MQIIVDEQDEWLLDAFPWNTSKKGDTHYAQAYVKQADCMIMLHHFIVGRPLYGREVDHVDGNALNNRRCNLQIVTRSVNQLKAKLRCDNKSGFKGVIWNKKNQNWNANVRINGRLKHIGCFGDVCDAVAAREDYLLCH